MNECPHRQKCEGFSAVRCAVGIEGYSECGHYRIEWHGEDGERIYQPTEQCWIYEQSRAEAAEKELASLRKLVGELVAELSETASPTQP